MNASILPGAIEKKTYSSCFIESVTWSFIDWCIGKTKTGLVSAWYGPRGLLTQRFLLIKSLKCLYLK